MRRIMQIVMSCAVAGLVFAGAIALSPVPTRGVPLTTISVDSGGFRNALRNSSLTAWFHGVGSLTIATSGGWCAEGIYVKPTGASVTCQQTTTCPTGNPTFWCVKITSAASVTAIQVRFVVESLTAAKFAGLQTTFQFLALNNCGASVTPTIQALYPTAQDDYTTTGTDLASANMLAIANSASQVEAYSWSTSANIDNKRFDRHRAWSLRRIRNQELHHRRRLRLARNPRRPDRDDRRSVVAGNS